MKRFITLIVAVIIVVIPLTSYGWTRTYGGESSEYACWGLQTEDDGYIIVANIEWEGYVWLIKTDAYGDTLWTRIYRKGHAQGRCIQKTSDGGWIVLGNIYDGPTTCSPWLLKIDSHGDTLWTRKYEDYTYYGVRGRFVQQTSDGGYIIAGENGHFGPLFVIKTDELGDTLWTGNYYYTPGGGSCIQETDDGNYVISGPVWDIEYAYQFGPSPSWDDGLYLFKINSTGDSLWHRTYVGGAGYYVEQASDGGYIITGTNGYPSVLWLLKTDSLGDTLWTRLYGGEKYHDVGYCVHETDDGGFVISGEYASQRLWLLKTDSQGDTLWTRTYGEEGGSCGYCVQQTNDGGYVIVGNFYTTGNSYDVWLLKTNEYGDTLWYDVSPFTLQKPQEGDTIAYMIPAAWFTNLSSHEVADFYCHCEIASNQFHTPDYHVKYWISYSIDPGDSILVKFSPWACDDSASYTARFYTSKEDEPLWQTREKSITFYGEPFSGVVEDYHLPPHWEIITSCGHEIMLRYCNFPDGLQGCIFDASGRKVDELKSFDASGTITWGDTAPTGVYFIRISSGVRSAMRKVILLR